MAHILLVAALVVSFSVPALAAKRYYNRGSPDDCRIVNIAPGYAKTTIRKGKRVYITRPTAARIWPLSASQKQRGDERLGRSAEAQAEITQGSSGRTGSSRFSASAFPPAVMRGGLSIRSRRPAALRRFVSAVGFGFLAALRAGAAGFDCLRRRFRRSFGLRCGCRLGVPLRPPGLRALRAGEALGLVSTAIPKSRHCPCTGWKMKSKFTRSGSLGKKPVIRIIALRRSFRAC